MSHPPMPQSLHDAIRHDLHPVRPLPAPWWGALGIAAVGLLLVAGTAVLRPLRDDLGLLSPALTWGSVLLQAMIGTLLAGLALRESIPGSGSSLRVCLGALTLGYLSHVTVALATWMSVPSAPVGSVQCGVTCMYHEVLFALPAFAAACLLIVKALPTRAPVAGALGGAAAGLIADAGVHLHCPISSPAHVIVWHGAGFFIMVGLGTALGWLWQRLQRP